MEPLTEVQRQTLEYLQSAPPGKMPSYRDIQRHFGLRSVAPVQSRLEYLRKKGYITWEAGRPHTLRCSRPDHQWVAVPESKLPLVEALLTQPDSVVATVEQVLADARRRQRAAENYSGVALL